MGIAAAALLLLASPSARADVTWTLTTTGDWSAATNWSGGAVPTSTDNADIYNGGTATITQTGEVCDNLSLGSTAGSGAINMTDGNLFVTFPGSVFVGYSGTGAFTQSGGTSSSWHLCVGYNAGSSGIYSLSGTGQLSTVGEEYIGCSGTGTFTQSSGTNNVASSGGLCSRQQPRW